MFFRCTKKVWLLPLLVLSLLAGTRGSVWAAPYGTGTYSQCPYGQSCPNPPSTAGGTTPTDSATSSTPPASSTTTTANGTTGSTEDSASPLTTGQNAENTPLPTSGSSTPRSYEGNTVEGNSNAPLEHQLTPQAFGGQVYQDIGRAIRRVPAPVAYTFPYLLLLLILLLVVRLVWQTQQELRRIAVAADTTKRERELSLEKENFLMLASHYLRTPLTIIKGNLELLQSLNTITADNARLLADQIARVQEPAEAMLKDLTENKVLNSMTTPSETPQNPLKPLLSPLILIPLTLAMLLVAIIQFLLVDFEVITPDALDFIVQIAIAVLLAQLFVSRYRAHVIRRANRRDRERLLTEQRELDRARSEVITGMATTLSEAIAGLGRQIDNLQEAGSDMSRLRTGYGQLQNMAQKFRLASQLEAQAVQLGKMQFASSQLIDQVVADNLALAKEKGVSIEVDDNTPLTLQQNQQLLHMAVDSLINNAVKFSKEDSVVHVATDTHGNTLRVRIQDNGPGLSKEQLSTLFKPFSRAESVETFNTEGLGFSLYLARLITQYLGGDISLDSKAGQGTLAFVQVPAT